MANGADCFTVDALAWEQNPVQTDQYSVQITRAQFQALHLSQTRVNKFKTGQDPLHVWIFVDKNHRALPFTQGAAGGHQLTLRRLVNGTTGHELYRLEGWQAPQAPAAAAEPSPRPDATDANALLARLQFLSLDQQQQQQPLQQDRMQQLQFYMARMQFFMGEVNAAAAEIFKLVTQQ